jgi:3-oxoadipate enol-lactonase
MPTITIDGLPFHIRVDGPEGAPTLLLSNSLSSDMTMWDGQLLEWSRRFRVVRYDQRGHGLSAVPEGPYSMDRLGRDAVAVLDALGIRKAHWCGLSLGGMVGMWMLTHAPHRVDRVILSNTAAHMGPPDLWNSRIRTATRGGMEALVDPTITRWFTQDFITRDPAEIERMRRMVLGTPVKGYQGCCAAIRDMDQRHSIRQASNPVLVLIGAHDPATTPEAGRLIHQRIAGSKAVTLNAAHIGNVEDPDAFLAATLDFLAG